MKNFSIVLIACVTVFQMGTADDKYAKECLVENGFKESDMNLLERRNILDVTKNVPKDRISCVMACIFLKENPDKNPNDLIKDSISHDAGKSENERKEILETLSTCKTQAGDDVCKLFQCIKVTERPFINVLDAVSLNRDISKCFVENGLEAPNSQFMFQMQSLEGVQELLKIYDENKLACTLACVYNKQDDEETSSKTLSQRLEARINANIPYSEKLTDDQKKELLETLNKCTTEAAGDNCKLVKCIKILRAPFLNLYTKSKNLQHL